MKRHWDKRQIRDFARDVRQRAGEAWSYLGAPARRALVDSKVLAVVRLQARDEVPMEAIDELYVRMHEACGTVE